VGLNHLSEAERGKKTTSHTQGVIKRESQFSISDLWRKRKKSVGCRWNFCTEKPIEGGDETAAGKKEED